MDDQGRFDAKQLFQDFNPSKFVIFASLFLQSIVLSVRLDNTITSSYWLVFIPLWLWKAVALAGAAVGFAVYRRHQEARYDPEIRKDVLAMGIATALHTLILLFEILLVVRLEIADFQWRIVFIPVFILCAATLMSCIYAATNKRDFELECVTFVNLLQFIFISIRLDDIVAWRWAVVFIPMWICIVCYFIAVLYHLGISIIVQKKAMHVPPEDYCSTSIHGFVSLAAFISLVVFMALLSNVLDGSLNISFAAVFVPLHLFLLTFCLMSLYKRGGNHWWFGIRMDFCTFLLTHCSLLQEYGNIVYTKPTEDDLPAGQVDAVVVEPQSEKASHKNDKREAVVVLKLDCPD